MNFKHSSYLLLSALVVLLAIQPAAVLAQDAKDTINLQDVDINKLKDVDINKLKDEVFADLLPPELKNVTLPKLEDILAHVKDKCSKVAGSGASYDEAELAAQNFGECMKDLVDFNSLPEEIKKAKPTGDLDTVFNKYCRRRSAAIECVDTFSSKIDVCLDSEERESKVVLVNIVHGLLNFVCHKDGDQIALFIAEEGPECFSDQKDALIDCANKTLSGYLNEETPSSSTNELPKLVMGKKQCDEMTTLQECMVQVLEGCKESTPANLVESLFKFVRRETPCANLTGEATPRTQARGAGELTKPSYQSIIISTWIMALIANILGR